MRKILVPLDGSDNSRRALLFAIGLAQDNPLIELLLLNVQPSIESALVREFISTELINKHYYEQGMKILAPAETLASEAGVRFAAKTMAGAPAHIIADCVKQEDCDHIVMGTRGMGTLESIVLGSVASKTIHLAAVPVTVVK
ncbi:MAG TPA: universal stress protein [Burkholderiaceae bacterium]